MMNYVEIMQFCNRSREGLINLAEPCSLSTVRGLCYMMQVPDNPLQPQHRTRAMLYDAGP